MGGLYFDIENILILKGEKMMKLDDISTKFALEEGNKHCKIS